MAEVTIPAMAVVLTRCHTPKFMPLVDDTIIHMATAPEADGDGVIDEFLSRRGLEPDEVGWERDHNKKKCPDCGGLHELSAMQCSVCNWTPD